MRDDRDEYNEQDDSEYHFSEDDVSYDVETQAPKASSKMDVKKMLSGFTGSKRMLIALVVFFGLIFIVYKMVSPNTVVPSTEIAPVVATKQEQKLPENARPAPTVEVRAQAPATPQVQSIAAPSSVSPTPTVSAPSVSTPLTQPVMAVTPPPPAPATTPPTNTMMGGLMPVSQPLTAQAASPESTASTVQPTGVQPVSVIPPASVIDQGIAAMTATENGLTAQMQANANQKVSDFEAENKALKDQLSTLNARMSTMEAQLNQLVQVLLKQNQSSAAPSTSAPVVPAEPAAPKLSYNVQAIIPGRAWLRSDSGETLTVAEGDTIKDVGRVTKIDPYDGVVQIDVNGKLVSLSYGSGAES